MRLITDGNRDELIIRAYEKDGDIYLDRSGEHGNILMLDGKDRSIKISSYAWNYFKHIGFAHQATRFSRPSHAYPGPSWKMMTRQDLGV